MTPTLKIVLDARATTAHFPGVARATIGLLRGLSELSHPHDLAVLTQPDTPLSLLAAFCDRRLTRIVTNAAPLGLAQQWRLPLWTRMIQPDVWHAPYYIRPFVGIRRPIVTVFDVIGHVIPDALPSFRARLLFELMMRCSLHTAQHIITSSTASKRDLMRFYGVVDQTITVIPLAADAQFRPHTIREIEAIRSHYALPADYLLYLGSNKPHKNLPALIRAYAQLDTAAALVVAGRWDRRYPEAKRLAATLGLSKPVYFLHDIADDDVPALIAGALAFVYPSRYEGFGLPPLEAMACGTPVISSNAASLPEVMDDAGMVVAPEVVALRDAMQIIVDDAMLREQLRERGLARAQHFSWQATAQQTVQVYEKIYEETPRSAKLAT